MEYISKKSCSIWTVCPCLFASDPWSDASLGLISHTSAITLKKIPITHFIGFFHALELFKREKICSNLF